MRFKISVKTAAEDDSLSDGEWKTVPDFRSITIGYLRRPKLLLSDGTSASIS